MIKQRRRQRQYARRRNQQQMKQRQQLNQQVPRQPSQFQQLLDEPTSMTTNIGLIIGGCAILGFGVWIITKIPQWM